MATTKRSLRVIMNATAPELSTARNIAGQVDPLAMTALGDAVLTPENGDDPAFYNFNTTTGWPETAQFNTFAAATAGQVTVNLSAISEGGAHVDGIDFEVTLIDVTEGREKFPRRTITAPTGAALATAISGMEILAGDGYTFGTATFLSDVLTIVMPADRVIRVAASDGATITTAQAPVLHKGLTYDEAVEYCKQIATVQYGRTNRVGFPVVEPTVETVLNTAIGSATGFDLIKVPVVSEVKFDKNFGDNYQDVEYYEFLVADDVDFTASKVQSLA